MHHTAILENTATGRFHPMPFRPSPRPSEGVPDIGVVCRHKSIGHHTEGFASLAEAEAHIMGNQNMWPAYTVYEWDGSSVPATTGYFPYMQAVEKPKGKADG